jgi:tRNA (cmo5U34)-methyltransferase
VHRDQFFNEPIVKQFEFDDKVAAVFDDMVSRSVPYYKEVQELIVSFALKHLNKDDVVYDLGCSTASTLLALEQSCETTLKLYGIDNSKAMIDKAKTKLLAYNSQINLDVADILTQNYQNSHMFISNYTLQFIRPLKRSELVKKIYDALEPNGVFIFSEKVILEDKVLDKEFIDIYYDYKAKQGYTQYEIAQKREALENVLVPYTYEENVEMLKEAGFEIVDTLFRWVNFTTFIAKKSL